MTGFWYLATPYSAYPGGIEAAAADAAEAARICLLSDLVVFSPIVHCHPIAMAGKLPSDAGFWQRYDRTMIQASLGIIVVTMNGWERSVGVLDEIEFAGQINKPVFFMPLEGPVPLEALIWQRQGA